MNELVEEVLRAAGITAAGDGDPVEAMEAWLGLAAAGSSATNGGGGDAVATTATGTATGTATVEDCLPLSDAVHRAAANLFAAVWNHYELLQHRGGTLSAAAKANPFLGAAPDPGAVALERVLDGVRVTLWLRHWMELNLSADGGGAATSSPSILSHLLRQEQEAAATTAASGHHHQQQHGLIRALFRHIDELPLLQSQLFAYLQSLQRPTGRTRTAGGAPLQDVAGRLEQYQRAMAVSAKLQGAWQEHTDRLQVITAEMYRWATTEQRLLLRRLLGHVWSHFVLVSSSASSVAAAVASSTAGGGLRQENTQAAAIPMTVTVLHRILLGVDEENVNTPPYEHLLFHQLIPLHQPSTLVLWRDQTSVLELYHEPLTRCVAVLLQKHPPWIPRVIAAMLQQPAIFPVAGNTSKQVLLLHEMDTFVGLLQNVDERQAPSNGDMNTMMTVLTKTLARCMASEHSRVAERALQFFRNKTWEQLVQREEYLDGSMRALLPALVKGEPSWNPTVRKMTYNVLKQLKGYDESVFERVCNELFSSESSKVPSRTIRDGAPTGEATSSRSSISTISTQPAVVVPRDHSLKAGMGTWRPPSKGKSSRSMPPPAARSPTTGSSKQPGRGKAPWAVMPGAAAPQQQPPLTVTGVAPRASQGNSQQQPPVTVTGVAPWAVTKQQQSSGSTTRPKRRAPDAHLNGISEEGEKETALAEPRTGLERVSAYMEQLKPPEEEEGVSSWSKAQMAETPTYLPNLKFHDLVFGHELGTGAFGSVRYARLIDKTKSRSQWPEYAVKIISTEKIREMGYEASVQREIAVLRVLSHPGIARLVSSFRFRDGAYLVLEYASAGDLHSLLQKHGSLDHDSTRFVTGEVVAALASIHEMGYVFADLKPENVVITEPGHIKLTDFGGCRPVTEDAKKLIQTIAKDLLKNLRDGDWKFQAPSSSNGSDALETEEETTAGDDMDVEEDLRIEGTTAYLPPEVVMGGFPTTAADSWALGCVMYQCLTGRPPLLEINDEATRNRIVRFDVHDATSEVDRLFQDKHASGISSEARNMIERLLNRDSSKRPGMNQVAEHDFFSKSGVDVFSLYSQKAYPLDVGDVSPTPDAQWSRRQFSSIWAPQPAAYDITLPSNGNGAMPAAYGPSSDAPIAEGEERTGFFSSSGRLPTKLANISERVMPLPPS
jgi:serine/threonine protein kinase